MFVSREFASKPEDVERDSLARQGLHEDLHAATEAKHEVERRLLLDVVVGESAAYERTDWMRHPGLF